MMVLLILGTGVNAALTLGTKRCADASETVETSLVTARKGFGIEKDTFCDARTRLGVMRWLV